MAGIDASGNATTTFDGLGSCQKGYPLGKPCYDPRRKTTRWGRVVVFASFMALLLHTGVPGTLGMFLPIFLREFDYYGAGELGWVASAGVSIDSFAGPVSSVVVKRIGCRRAVMLGGVLMFFGTGFATFASSVLHLFICLGLVAGLGGSLIHVATVVVIGKYYSRHYTVANGLAYAGPGAGVFVFPPLVQLLVGTYGWRGSLIIEAAIVSNVVMLGALVRPASRFKSRLHKSHAVVGSNVCKKYNIFNGGESTARRDVEKSDDTGSSEEFSENEVLQSIDLKSNTDTLYKNDSCAKSSKRLWKRFWTSLARTHPPKVFVVYIVCLFHTAGYSSVSVHLVNQAVLSGMTDIQASVLLSCVGVGSLAGRLTHSWFLTRKYITPLWMFTVSLLVCVLATALLPQHTTLGGKIASATAIGVCCGICFSLVAVIIRELVGIMYLSAVFGVSLFCSGIGATLGAYVTGVVRDVTDSYDVPFYLISGYFAIAAITSLSQSIVYWYRGHRDRLPGPKATPL